ncbi:MAG: ABC transporter substrate-binding protein [Planctomycetes bacterium]|jgi:iron complex transport system substrate-binding protein|nr:ABC transporter substrate-binding protein [Phycisphaerae bacterium]NBB94659.1 ABC transporter substrate-binding protein [Planctomycetota bacterium]
MIPPATRRRSLLATGLTALLLTACASREPVENVPRPRIISHTPAITEMLIDMGYGEHLVGVSNWCDLPPGRDIPRVADANGVRLEAALAVRPDLLLTQSAPASFEQLKSRLPQMEILRLQLETLEDIEQAMVRLVEVVEGVDARQAFENSSDPTRGMKAIIAWKTALDETARDVPLNQRPNVLFISGWRQPVVAGPETFIGDLIAHVGGTNAGEAIPGTQRWRKAQVESIIRAQPDVLIIKTTPEKVGKAREFWTSQRFRALLPAARNDRVFAVSNDAWLRPSPTLKDMMQPLRTMVGSVWASGDEQ